MYKFPQAAAWPRLLETQMINERGWIRRHPLYSHVSVRAGLAAGQGSALGRGDAALAHLAAKVVPLVPHGALQRAVPAQVRAGVV